jgi:antitoxin component of MazEF toxin-antitoxin module
MTIRNTERHMSNVTVRKHGNSVGVAIPAETRIRMGFEVGQELTLIELADGIKLVKRNMALERQLALAREVLGEQADALQELAKR